MVTYKIAIDTDGDNYANVLSSSSDDDNLIPKPHHPIQNASGFLNYNDNGGLSTYIQTYFRHMEVSPFANSLTAILIGDLGISTLGPFDLGRDGSGVVDDIPVDELTQYTFSIYITHEFSPGLNLDIIIKDQSGNTIASNTNIPILSTWTRPSVTFTTGSGDTYIYITLQKTTADTNDYGLILAAPMLNPGATAQNFNTGSGHTNDHLHQDVEYIEWKKGLQNPYDTTPQPCTGYMILNNQGNDYWNSAATWLKQSRYLTIVAEDSGTDYLLAHLAILKPITRPGDYQKRRLTVLLTDQANHLWTGTITPPLRLDHWFFSITNELLLFHQDIYNLAAYEKLEWNPKHTALAGHIIIEFIGDTWADGINTIQAIDHAAFLTRSRFWIDKYGRASGWEYPKTSSTAVATISAMHDLGISYGDYLTNFARVWAQPRKSSAADTIAWNTILNPDGNYGGPVPLAPGESLKIVAHLRSDQGFPLSLASLNAFDNTGGSWPSQNAYMNTQADFAGTDISSSLSGSFTERGSSVLIEATNNHATLTGYTYFQIGGTILLLRDPLTFFAYDETSIDEYGIHTAELKHYYFADKASAQEAIDDLIANRKDPRLMATWIHLTNNVGLTHILNRDMFDLVTIQESGYSGLNALHAIISIEHKIHPKSGNHDCIFGLELWEYTS